MTMPNKELSRRDFLLRVSALGAFAAGSSTVLAACGGGESGSSGAAEPAPAPEPEPAMADCSDLSGLSDADMATSNTMRTSLEYVDTSTVEGQTCGNCALYKAAEAGSSCGGCQLFAGPITDGGYCKSWVVKPA